MDLWHVAAALLSAVLHAGWNAAVKASADPKSAMTAQMVMSALLVVPVLAWTGLPQQAAWPWLAGSTLLNLATVIALLKAYEGAGFGVAYPIVRAVAVLLVVPLATFLSGESLSLIGLAGIGFVVASLLTLALGNTGAHALPRTALGWIAVAGLTTAAYVMCDAQGVRRAGSALAYGCAVSITNAAVMLAVRWNALPARADLGRYALWAVPVALAAVVSYLLILWVWTVAPVAPSAALRDTSATFAILIAVLWLREPMTWQRLVATLLAAAAIPLLRLA